MTVLWGVNSFFIFNNSHASLFRYNLNRTYPLTMWHRIDNPSMQELKNLFLNNLSHHIVKPTLGLPRRYRI
jgi:hypothetical protein